MRLKIQFLNYNKLRAIVLQPFRCQSKTYTALHLLKIIETVGTWLTSRRKKIETNLTPIENFNINLSKRRQLRFKWKKISCSNHSLKTWALLKRKLSPSTVMVMMILAKTPTSAMITSSMQTVMFSNRLILKSSIRELVSNLSLLWTLNEAYILSLLTSSHLWHFMHIITNNLWLKYNTEQYYII